MEEGGEKKKKKKKGKKEEDTSVPIEKCDNTPATEEKKGFLDKIKEKLPGGQKPEEAAPAATPPPPADEYAATPETEGEKKGFLEKIKEKIPGFHSKTDDEKVKEKEKESGHN